MKHLSNSRFNYLLVIFLLYSCFPVAQSRAATQISSTNTQALSSTSTPSPFPLATQSHVDKIFIIPTYLPYPEATPAPIAAPSLGHSLMQLRGASEEDLLGLISELQERSYHNFPPHDGWWSEGQFVSSQEPVALAIQEYLYRFPNSPASDRLRWQLAFIESIMFEGLKGNEYYDEWIVEQLEGKLNQGLVFPEDLESFLDFYWFEVRYYQVIENLFGDQRLAWFYVIEPQVWEKEEHYEKSSDFFDRGGLFIVVREIDQGKFGVHILENGWNFPSGSSSLFEISDFNENDASEIAINVGLHSGTMCRGNLKIFEWSDNAFADLTRGNIQVGDCSDNYEYVLVEGQPAIRLKNFFTPVPSLYVWNGSYYEFSRYEHTTLLEKWLATTRDPKKSYSEEAEAIEAILASENMEGMSSAHVDFLRFRLGLAYALDSEVLQAERILQDLADFPLDKTRLIYSEFAKNFLKYYSGDSSLYLACQKSREIFDSKSSSLTAEEEEELFGITSDLTFGIGMLRCFDRDVFTLLINEMPVVVENVADALRQNGVKLHYVEKQDVNLDGSLEEWLIIIGDGVFVVLPDLSNYQAIELQYFWYGEDTSRYLKTVAGIERWNGIKEPVLTISTGQEFSIMAIGEEYDSASLNSEYDLANVLFSPQSSPAQYQVFFTKPTSEEKYYDVPWKGYRWDSVRRMFRDDLIEYSLFIERSPDKAVEIAELVLPLLGEWKDLDSAWQLPRYFYLCGLSYELSGDAQKAAEVYWQLWHDYPGSQYALLARYKLVPVNP